MRNKVFHGQLTERCLQRDDLGELSDAIRQWCSGVADGASVNVGYDGSEEPSFRKAPTRVADGLRIQLQTPEEFQAFIRGLVDRR